MSDWSLEILMYAQQGHLEPSDTKHKLEEKQTHSNLQPEEKEARDWKTSCQKKMSAARKQIEESTEYKIFKTGSSPTDRKYGNADTRDIHPSRISPDISTFAI